MDIDWFTARGLLTALLLPPGGPLVLIALGLWLIGRHPALGRALAAFGLVAAYLMSTNAIGSQLLRWVEPEPQSWSPRDLVQQMARMAQDAPRAIVVLGGGLARERRNDVVIRDRLSTQSLERVVHAARLARATRLPVLVSGGRIAPHRATEAEMMRRALEDDLGVPVRWVEQVSQDTAENAARSAELLRAEGIDRILLVTHAYHMRRAARAFENAGLAVVQAPDHFASGTTGEHWRDWVPTVSGVALNARAARELVGGVWYRVAR